MGLCYGREFIADSSHLCNFGRVQTIEEESRPSESELTPVFNEENAVTATRNGGHNERSVGERGEGKCI